MEAAPVASKTHRCLECGGMLVSADRVNERHCQGGICSRKNRQSVYYGGNGRRYISSHQRGTHPRVSLARGPFVNSEARSTSVFLHSGPSRRIFRSSVRTSSIILGSAGAHPVGHSTYTILFGIAGLLRLRTRCSFRVACGACRRTWRKGRDDHE